MKVAHFGTFDVENYGDLLFPLVLERRLAGLCDEFVHVSPVGGPPPWADCVETVGFSQFSHETSDVDGVVVGGGQIIRATPTPLDIYNTGGISSFLTYPSLWLGASYVVASEDLPLCWNAAGVPGKFAPTASQLVRWTASATDYLAVRDEPSRHWLREAGVEQDIEVVPDTAVEVSTLWTEEEVAEAYEDAFVRRSRTVPDRSVVCHVNSRWAGEDYTAIAARIDRICRKLDATAILIAIGPCHGDGEVQRSVTREMDTDPLLIDKPRSLREVASCVARSEAYLGSSLHGMITACSFGRRGMMIASAEDAKYSGFLQHFGLASWLVESWGEAERRIDELLASPLKTWESVRETAGPVLDRHWSRVRATLERRDDVATDTPQAHGKRGGLEQLKSIGRDRYGDLEPFHAFIAESLEANDAQLQTIRRRLAEESRELRKARRKHVDENRELEKVRGELRVERQSLQATKNEVARLSGWIEELDEGIVTLLNSRRWKASSAVAELRQKALRKPEGPTAMDHLEAILKQYRAWRSGRDLSTDGSRAGSRSNTRG